MIAATDKGILTSGTWSNVSSYKESTQVSARLKLTFLGDEATLSMGEGPDHALYDVYINDTFWQSFDGYAAAAAQRDIVVTTDVDGRKLQGEGPHVLEIRNRAEKNANSTDYKVRFKQLTVENRTWTQQTIAYTYDKLSRLKEARYNPGLNTSAANADLLRHYLYTFDRAGNREMQSVAVNGASPTVTNYTSYNGINQVGAVNGVAMTYDANGNLIDDGINTYVWDRANRLLSVGSSAYAYDGMNNRVQQTVGGTATKYLLDLQPGLTQVIAAATGGSTDRYVHGLRGIHAMKGSAGAWIWPTQDGLGNVRQEVSDALAVNGARGYEPFLTPFDEQGSFGMPFGATGEMTDVTGQVYLRARYYNPNFGLFSSLDPFEGVRNRAMSLNGYSWVEGNAPNAVDPSGMQTISNCQWVTTPGGIGYLDCSFNQPTNPVDNLSDYCSLNPAACLTGNQLPTITSSSNNFSSSIAMIDPLTLCKWLNGGACTLNKANSTFLMPSFECSNGDQMCLLNASERKTPEESLKKVFQNCLISDDSLLRQISTCAAAGILGYLAGLILYNALNGETDDLSKGFNWNDLVNNAIYGGVLCGLNWALASSPKLVSYAKQVELATSTKAFAYAYLGANAYILFNYRTNRNIGNNNLELSIWAMFGALNIMSICGGLPGALLTTAANTLASLVGNASDNWNGPVLPVPPRQK